MKAHKIKIFGILVISAFLIMLPVVSLLGENDRSVTVVQAYFDAISKKQFRAASELCVADADAQTKAFSDEINRQFALETALINHFGIHSEQEYTIKAKRDSLWIPFFGKDTIQLSVRVQSLEESGSIIKKYLDLEGGEYLPGFVSLVRSPGGWRIKKVNVEESALAESYAKGLEAMQASSLYDQQNDSIVIRQQTLNLDSMDSIEKRIISFQLTKIVSLINDEQK